MTQKMEREDLGSRLESLKTFPLSEIYSEYKEIFHDIIYQEVSGFEDMDEAKHQLFAKVFEDIKDRLKDGAFKKEAKDILVSVIKICKATKFKDKLEDFMRELEYPYLNNLERAITRFDDMPEKDDGDIRVASYNVAADFFDNKDTTEDQRHHWENRKIHITKLLKMILPDIMCLQELSVSQALYLSNSFEDFRSMFLSQTPSEIEAGIIVEGDEVISWLDKYIGTPLLGIFVSNQYNISSKGRFWLNENPDEIPYEQDRGETDKGFGNLNTYRAILWSQIEKEGHNLFIFNSHYPLSGGNRTRKECAILERKKIEEIVGENNWISAGDRNIIPTPNDSEDYNISEVYKSFTNNAYDVRDNFGHHYGTSSTWLGFTYDDYKSDVNPKNLKDHFVLDLIISNLKPNNSLIHPGGYNNGIVGDSKIIPLSSYDSDVIDFLNTGRYFASDHAMLAGDFPFTIIEDS